MIDNKHINKLTAVIMVLAVIGMIIFMVLYNVASPASGMTMEYESTVFGSDEVLKIDFQMDEGQWEDLLENAIMEEYYPCDIAVNGTVYKNVGLRAKGNSSLSMVASSDSDRYSFKISFDQYVDGQSLDGLSSLILNNNYGDATMMKEAICFDMFNFLDADASLYNYAEISVNGEYWGVYLALEPVEEDFAIRNYGLSYGQIYKPDSEAMGGPGRMKNIELDSEGNAVADEGEHAFGGKAFGDRAAAGGAEREFAGEAGGADKNFGISGGGADLNYIDDNLDSYEAIWDNSVFTSTDKDHNRVVTALKNICGENVSTDTLEDYMDVDNVLRYMAVHTFVVNLDSLSGSMAHNYYLYEENGRLNMIPWDYNLSFGGFQSGNASEAVNFPIDTPFSNGISMEQRQFFAALLENEEYLATYHEYLRKLAEEYVGSGQFEETVENIRSRIDSLVESDPTSFFTYEQYDAASEMFLKTVSLRAESVLGQIEGTVPSTRDGQQENAEALIDASGIDISVMGSQGGKGGNRGGFGAGAGDLSEVPETPEAPEAPAAPDDNSKAPPEAPDSDMPPEVPDGNAQGGFRGGGAGGKMPGGQRPEMTDGGNTPEMPEGNPT